MRSICGTTTNEGGSGESQSPLVELSGRSSEGDEPVFAVVPDIVHPDRGVAENPVDGLAALEPEVVVEAIVGHRPLLLRVLLRHDGDDLGPEELTLRGFGLDDLDRLRGSFCLRRHCHPPLLGDLPILYCSERL
jgi:hypothetical protein